MTTIAISTALLINFPVKKDLGLYYFQACLDEILDIVSWRFFYDTGCIVLYDKICTARNQLEFTTCILLFHISGMRFSHFNSIDTLREILVIKWTLTGLHLYTCK